jgi:hypothetical protein
MQYKTENSTLCSNFQSLVQCTERFSLCVMGTCQLIQRTSPCTLRKTSCCSRNVTSAGWCFVVYENHPPHLAHCVCHNQDLDVHDSAFLPQITMQRLQYTSVKLPPIRLSTLTYPESSQRFYIAKNIRTVRLHARHLPIYASVLLPLFLLAVIESQLAALQLPAFPRILSEESPANCHSNTKQQHCKNVVTWKRFRIWKVR